MKIYIYAFLVLAATLIAHLFGINGLYWNIPSYDIFMHILGGVGIGLFVLAFLKSNFSRFADKKVVIVLGVLGVGIIWELFEMYFNIAGAPVGTKAYYIDTTKDLFDDMVGGAIVAWSFIRK
ncbi:MAG: hypothetical protein WCP09_03775 [Candidatus Taylorbacteria bacterium]